MNSILPSTLPAEALPSEDRGELASASDVRPADSERDFSKALRDAVAKERELPERTRFDKARKAPRSSKNAAKPTVELVKSQRRSTDGSPNKISVEAEPEPLRIISDEAPKATARIDASSAKAEPDGAGRSKPEGPTALVPLTEAALAIVPPLLQATPAPIRSPGSCLERPLLPAASPAMSLLSTEGEGAPAFAMAISSAGQEMELSSRDIAGIAAVETTPVPASGRSDEGMEMGRRQESATLKSGVTGAALQLPSLALGQEDFARPLRRMIAETSADDSSETSLIMASLSSANERRTDPLPSSHLNGISAAEADARMRSLTSTPPSAEAGERLRQEGERGERHSFEGGAAESLGDQRESFSPDSSTDEMDSAVRSVSAMDWLVGRPVEIALDRPTQPASAAAYLDRVASAERLSQMVVRETMSLRQTSAESLAVVLRPDPNTELFIQLTRRDGQIEAVVRCERGDAQQLGALWGQLQETLSQQNIRLAPLQESSSNNFNSNSSSPHSQPFVSENPTNSQGDRHAHRQSAAEGDLTEESSPATSPGKSSARARASENAGPSASRLNWQTWA